MSLVVLDSDITYQCCGCCCCCCRQQRWDMLLEGIQQWPGAMAQLTMTTLGVRVDVSEMCVML
jgi:hypothetical protein